MPPEPPEDSAARRTRHVIIQTPAWYVPFLEPHRYKGARGGRGSGKSSFVSLELLLLLMRDPDLNAAVFRKVAATMRESVLEQLVWAARMLGVDHLWRAQVSPPEMVYAPTGQRILFRGADDLLKLRGLKYPKGYCSVVWFEELDPFEDIEIVKSILNSLCHEGDLF